jgi:aryl-alcohol dehydrogenase-like predicted oxidoreductase
VTMRYRRFEPLERDLSVLVLGTAEIAGRPEEDAFALLDAWREAGGNVIDCARQYGDGACEEVLGRWLADRDGYRETAVITKGAHHFSRGDEHDPARKRVTPEYIAADLEESLTALGTETVDLYFLHRDDPSKPVGPIVEALDEHRRAGRVRVLGASNWTVARLEEANLYAAEHGLAGFECSSPGLSLAEADDEPWPDTVFARSKASRDWYARTQKPVFAWSSQAGGFFVGVRNADIERVYLSDRNLERLRRASELGRRQGVGPNEVALAWVLHQPFPTYALIGPQTPAELESSLRALEVELTADDVRWLDLEDGG